MGVSRGHEWVEREYGREKWPAIEALIEEARGEEAQLARLVGRVALAEAPGALEPRETIVGGRRHELPLALGAGAYQALIVRSVLDACSARTGLILELGSGWGRNVLLAWLQGGPRGAVYAAAEYTEAGRRAAARLAEAEPELDFRSIAFDYHRPDLSELGRAGEAVVFSAHSIEQIPQLPDELVDSILGVGERVTCLHFEPVGWQIGGGAEGSSREHAERHDYNRNLVDLLLTREERGDIRIDTMLPDVVGNNPANSTSVIRWRSGA